MSGIMMLQRLSCSVCQVWSTINCVFVPLCFVATHITRALCLAQARLASPNFRARLTDAGETTRLQRQVCIGCLVLPALLPQPSGGWRQTNYQVVEKCAVGWTV